jgi:proline iminopeptidase
MMPYRHEGDSIDTIARVQEGYISVLGHKVWYRVVGGQEESGKSPLICVHGGPGATHDYLAPFEKMTEQGRQVVLYDQLGGGKSDHVHDTSLWTVDLFVEELSKCSEMS